MGVDGVGREGVGGCGVGAAGGGVHVRCRYEGELDNWTAQCCGGGQPITTLRCGVGVSFCLSYGIALY